MTLILALLIALPSTEGTLLAAFPEPAATPIVFEDLDPDELPNWSGSIAIGANWTGGNTRTEGVNGTADGVYRRVKDRTTLGAFYAYSKNRIHDVLNQDYYGARVQYDYFLSEKTYALAQSSYEVDTVAKLRSRMTAGAGLGRQFREDHVVKFSGEGGLTWKDEEYPNGVGGDDLTLRLAYNLDWVINESWEFSQSAVFLPVIDDWADSYTVVDTRLKASLTESMFGQVQYFITNDETPATGAQNTDHRLLLSVGWSF